MDFDSYISCSGMNKGWIIRRRILFIPIHPLEDEWVKIDPHSSPFPIHMLYPAKLPNSRQNRSYIQKFLDYIFQSLSVNLWWNCQRYRKHRLSTLSVSWRKYCQLRQSLENVICMLSVSLTIWQCAEIANIGDISKNFWILDNTQPPPHPRMFSRQNMPHTLAGYITDISPK